MRARVAGSALAAGRRDDADSGERRANVGVGDGAGLGAVAGSGAGAGHVTAKVDGVGQENADEPADDGASIQIILEPRMIKKNSVRSLDC